jgi:two-component system catabolic regulation response regulator CreB
LVADDYVTKPFSPRELVARIRVVLRRLTPAEAPRSAATELFAASGFELTQRTKPAFISAAQALDLTRYEYQLLKTLIQHPGPRAYRAHN